MNYFHYILTRFNIDLYTRKREKWKKDKNNRDIDSELWMEKRFKLFETYCLPSICNQINKNFKWLVVYDVKTPSKWFQKIESYKNICDNYVHIYNHQGIQRATLPYILKDCETKKISHVITTRLDNDDCLSNNAVELIQNNIDDNNLQFINILNGYQYNQNDKNFYTIQSESNSFITSLERTETAKTIYGWGNHAYIKDNMKKYIKNLDGDAGWLQIIHDDNLINNIKGKNIGNNIPKGFFFSDYNDSFDKLN